MRISLDAGALCGGTSGRFGTYVFTENMIEAFGRFDKDNGYIAYTFCDIEHNNHKNIFYKKLPQKLWMSYHVTAHELMEPNDVFLGLSQALPIVSKARIFTFLHGLSFLFFKNLYQDSYEYMKKQLEAALLKSDTIFVTSSRIKEELHVRYDYDKAIVVYPGIPFDMTDKTKTMVKYQLPRPNYFMFVGMNHPIKRVDMLVNMFKKFREKEKFKSFGLYLVGNFEQYEDPSNNIYTFPSISREELKYLYANAKAYVTTSLYESFHFPAIEALSQNCPVIGSKSAIIPELRKFVMSANDEREFMYWMQSIAYTTPQLPDQKELREMFSWEKTVGIIRSYYKQ